jgi:hypothetical protein
MLKLIYLIIIVNYCFIFLVYIKLVQQLFFLTSIYNFATRSMENLTEDGYLQFYTVDQQESSVFSTLS